MHLALFNAKRVLATMAVCGSVAAAVPAARPSAFREASWPI
jgi:hypothetical protein